MAARQTTKSKRRSALKVNTFHASPIVFSVLKMMRVRLKMAVIFKLYFPFSQFEVLSISDVGQIGGGEV